MHYKVYAGGSQARDDLAELLAPKTLIRAMTDVDLLVVPRAAIADTVPEDDGINFTVEYTPVSAEAKPEKKPSLTTTKTGW